MEVRVLGPVDVVGDDGSIALAGKQTRLLAALVVAGGRACGVDELVEAVWDGSAPPSARKLVQVYVSQLRKALPELELVTRGGAYALELGPEGLDAARFERLLDECRAAGRGGNPALAVSLAERALALWRGRAYGELGYEDTWRAETDRLEELQLVAREERLDAQLTLGRHDEVLGEALALAEASPFRERLHELAMLALYRSGRQTDALEHYAAARARLRDDLGLEPGPPLRELQRRILQHDPGLDLSPGTGPSASSLPMPPNPLLGRERELADLRALLERRAARLVVLTGAGGTGKTRLALEAARHVADAYANGVVLVELAPLRDPALVIPTVAQALDVSLDGAAEPVEVVARALSSLELLLLVDNAEHVREAASSFAELAARAPHVTILVTSRAVLHVSGEHVVPVAPLAEDDAIELFRQRARRLEPSFEITEENEADVREVCRRLDCLPLAIELAAGRIRTLTPRLLRERLDDRLRLLTGGPRDLPARQQTLRETIDWSVGLLDERHCRAFALLAVFPGGATVRAAEVVCAADLDTLAALVDVHLIRRDDVGGEPRFGMLETLREYALALLGDERRDAEVALARYYGSLVDDLRVSDPRESVWRTAVEGLDPEIDNVRVALAVAAESDDELLLCLAGGLWRYWWVRGARGEGLDWIERALAAGEGPATVARATALRGGAGLAWSRGDTERAKALASAAIPVAVEAGAKWDEGAAHTVLGIVANQEGDYGGARRHHERSLEISLELGVEPVVEKLNLGVVAIESADYETALTLLEDVLESHRRNERPGGIGFALLNLGLVRYLLGEQQESRRDFDEARACFEAIGFRSHVAYALQGLAAAEAGVSRFESAARLLGEARKELDDVGSPEDGFADELVESVKMRSRAALGDSAFEAAYAEGLGDG
jgi:predicted ATPase/DNA-binding SARP family transcriptional activator